MAGKGRGSAVSRGSKVSGRSGAGRKRDTPYDPRGQEEDPYRDLRIPDDEQNDPAGDDYIWPEFEDDDEDRV